MNKRRRTSSITSRSVDEDQNESDSPSPTIMETSRKRKRLDPSDLLHSIYDTLRSYKKEDGSLLCDSFIRAPKRRQEPGYYDVVTNPIDLLRVQQKLKTDEYEDIEDFQADIELLVNNTKAFYKRSSAEYKDAVELWELFLQTKNKLFGDGDETGDENKGKIILKVGKLARRAAASAADTKRQEVFEIEESSTESWSTSTNNDDELVLCEELFSAVMLATDPDKRPLHLVFQLLPSMKRYPKYYDVIENPIDLRTIARKIQDAKYNSIGEMEKDLLLMTRNACIFNEPGSQIYKDAKSLKKMILSKRYEIEHGKVGSKVERTRKRTRGSIQSLSAITAALRSEEEDFSDDEDAGDDRLEEDADDPRFQLYNAVKTYTNQQGVCISDAFWKLPSKRFVSNYYKEIKNPVSLMQIRRKLMNGEYGTISELAAELNVLFENTKKFNKPETKFYKDAVTLQKIMQSKLNEHFGFPQQIASPSSESEEEVVTDEPTKIKRLKSSKALTRGKYLHNIPLKRRLYSICKCLMDYATEDGRKPILMFMEKPSKKLLPDYYKVITEPMDMLTIENNIRNEKYTCEDEILKDLKLMFDNCRTYNEETSAIYEDAITLERVLRERVKELGPLDKSGQRVFVRGSTPTILRQKKPPLPSLVIHRMKTLFNALKEYKDPKGRQLSVIFNKSPSRAEYPDYYEVIKKPINLEIISHKLKNSYYDGMDDLVSDFILMFDNACKYNEPDSQIYKDALVLQRVTLQTKLALKEDEDTVPDVPSAVQELLTSLFTSVYNHQDEEGRCFSDSMAELPEHDEIEGKKVRGISLDLIKRRLDSGQYRRLDMFQEDMFTCLERARKLSRTDSQVFEDSIELQTFFIRQRDEICRNGDLLNSPALSYSLLDLSAAVDEVRLAKIPEEGEQLDHTQEEDVESKDDDDTCDDVPAVTVGAVDNAMSFNQQVYRIGDFVYVESKDRGVDPIILNIQRLWVNQENQQMMYGNHYYRPSETYHLTTRKFLEKEVFKTDQHISAPLSQIRGRCAVLSVKDYFRSKPEAFDDKDVYVCESRYSSRCRSFKKIKSWPTGLTNVWKLVDRPVPLEPKRNFSVFRERIEKHKEEIAELEEQEKLHVKDKPNVLASHFPANLEEGCVYYEQYNASNCLIKTGDCVYLKSENVSTTRTLICQVDKIWTNKMGEGMIQGSWLVLPADIPHPSNRLFYKQEILLSSLEDKHSINDIIGKCAVLEHSEYISCRPTEIPESDIYICESMFDESRQQISELAREGLKKYVHCADVFQDEIYFFRRLINPTKGNGLADSSAAVLSITSQNDRSQHSSNEIISNSTIIPKIEPPDLNTEDSMDSRPPSVCSSDLGGPHTPSSVTSFVSTPITTKKKGSGGTGGGGKHTKQVTGYILYSSDVRRSVQQNNPQMGFGEVSRKVGLEWKKLSVLEKNVWEEKAHKMNEETQAKIERGECVLSNCGQFQSSFIGPNLPDHVWECLWDNCDYMFEDQIDCLEHTVSDINGHVAQYFSKHPNGEIEYQCQWKNCIRIKKQSQPFPSLHRLIRHVKEVHILKNLGRIVPPEGRGQNYVQCSRVPPRAKTPPVPTPPPPTPQTQPPPQIQIQTRQPTPPPQHTLPPPSSSSSSHHIEIVNVNLVSSSGSPIPQNRNTPSPRTQQTVMFTNVGVNGQMKRGTEPLFVMVPPRPQRVMHSDIYLKYIDGLTAENRQICNWPKQLKASQETITTADVEKLPTNWLGNGAGTHGNVLNALWALRDYMFQDTLSLSRSL